MTTSDECSEPVGNSSLDNQEMHRLLNEVKRAQSGKTVISQALTQTGYTRTHQVNNVQAFYLAEEKIIVVPPKKGNPSTVCAVRCSVSVRT